jgi:hypothetical protein
VIGAPVFLQRLNPNATELAVQSWNVRADAQGRFTFQGLAPGSYRVMSSFDLDFEDPVARDRAVKVTLRESDAIQQALEVIRQ